MVKPSPNVPSAKAAVRPPCASWRGAASGRAPLPLPSSAARRGASCASRRRLAVRGRGRRRSRLVIHPIGGYSLDRRCRPAFSTSPTFTPARATRRGWRGAARDRRRARPRPRALHGRHHASRQARAVRPRVGAAAELRAAARRHPREPRHPGLGASAGSRRPGGSSTASGRSASRSTADGLIVVGLNSVRPYRHQSGSIGEPQIARVREAFGRRRTARSASSPCHHHLLGAPWRSWKPPLVAPHADAGGVRGRGRRARRRRPCPPVGGRRAARVRGRVGGERSAVVVTAPGLGQPRPNGAARRAGSTSTTRRPRRCAC